MKTGLFQEIQALSRMTVRQLREKYIEVFGEESHAYHKEFLRKRIAWRIQALAKGDLSERARRRAAELANDADLRIRTPRKPVHAGMVQEKTRTTAGRISSSRDDKLPKPGTIIVREYRGRDIMVKVLDNDFEFESRRYKSLSAIAREVTGTKWNKFLFFGIDKKAADSSQNR
jgi:hypothetical protein